MAAKSSSKKKKATQTKSRVVRVAIIDQSDAGVGPFLVRPSVVFLEDGDKLRFLNTTSRRVSITRPGPPRHPKGKARVVDPISTLGIAGRKVAPGRSWTSEGPLNSNRARRVFGRYQVEVTDAIGRPVRASGDSDPVIIIDNP